MAIVGAAAGKRARQSATRAGVAAAHAASRALSPLSIEALRRLGARAGELAWQIDGRAARTTVTNIDVVYGHRDRGWRRRLVRESLRNTGMLAAEAIALWTWPLPRLASLVQRSVGEQLLRERPNGRGALVLAPHFGNWEFLGYYINTIEPLAPLYERPASPVIDNALRAARARLGHRSAPDSVGGLRRLLTVLRGGGLAAVLPDQVPTLGAGVAAPFFGRPAYTVGLVAKLLARVDVDVVVATATRVADGFAIRFETVDPAIRDPDPVVSASAMNAAVEAVVMRQPAQYQWEYKRYRFPRQPNIYGEEARRTRQAS